MLVLALAGPLAHGATGATLPNDTYLDGDDDGRFDTGAWGQTLANQHYLKSTRVDKAWKHSKGNGIVVAVAATGVDYNHPDLADNIYTNPGESGDGKETNGIDDDGDGFVDDVHGWDFLNDNSDGQPGADNDPQDSHGGGTAVAGIIAAIQNNARGISGVAPEAKIMPVRLVPNPTTFSDQNALIIGLQFLVDQAPNVDVVVVPGGKYTGFQPEIVGGCAFPRAGADAGQIWVTAAGNGANENIPPVDIGFYEGPPHPVQVPEFVSASCPDVITTGGVTARTGGQIRPRSSFGNFGSNLQLVAPAGSGVYTSVQPPYTGSDIMGLMAAGLPSYQGTTVDVDGQYSRFRGTGAAAAQVGGAVALMLSASQRLKDANDGRALDGVRSILERTARPVERGTRPNTTTGYGELNAAAAVAKARAYKPPPPTP